MPEDRNKPPETLQGIHEPIPVLDHGFVRLVDAMGDDRRIVQAARVSYGDGTKTVREDRLLIDYLMAHGHTSPFEHVVLEFHCKMPLFVARQWIRHRTARVNEISGRYSVLREEFYLPPLEQIRQQSRDNKQGRSEQAVAEEAQADVRARMEAGQRQAYADYGAWVEAGLAREVARINLPLSLYTEWYWQMDLHNLFHFLKLRLDPHAQWEIRCYARAVAALARRVAPMAYEAFERHVLEARTFSRDEMEALRRRLAGRPHGLTGLAQREFERKLEPAEAGGDSAAG